MLLRILEIGQIEVLPQELLQYRVHAGAISAHCTDAQKIANVTALASAILRAQGQEDGIDEAAVIDERSMLQLAERQGLGPLSGFCSISLLMLQLTAKRAYRFC